MATAAPWPGYPPPSDWPGARAPTPAVPGAARAARRSYLAAAAVPAIAVAAFLYVGLIYGNVPANRESGLVAAMAIALPAGPLMLLFTFLGIRASRRAGEKAVRAGAVVELVLGALGTVAGVWVAFLLYLQLIAGPFY